jgi:ribosome-associated protein
MKSKKSGSLELVRLCCRALDEKKAGDLSVLDVSAQSSITNFLVLATATSDPHLRAMRVELEKSLDAAKARIVGIETAPDSGWTVIDAFDVMLHLFLPEKRAHYGLENLWKDAVKVSVSTLLKTSAAKPARKTGKKTTAPKPRRRSQ